MATLCAVAAQAQAPKSEAEIPIYAGAVRDAAVEARRQAEQKEAAAEEKASRAGVREMTGRVPARLLSSSVKVYRVNASVEDVMRFYRQRLGSKTEYGDEMDVSRLAPGQTTPVVYSPYLYDDQIQGGRDQNDEPFDCPLPPGEFHEVSEVFVEVRPIMAGRAPAEPGKWITEAFWWWSAKNAKGNPMDFRVDLLDVGISKDCKSWSPRTLIEVSVDVSQSEEQVAGEEQELERQEDRAHQERVAELAAKPPTERELGMPIYLGSRFDAQMSAGMSGEAEKYYVYLTNDPVTKVVAFYEAKTGKKAQPGDAGSYQIAVKGTVPWPELGVVIQPVSETSLPQYLGTAKTVVTIRKELAAAPE